MDFNVVIIDELKLYIDNFNDTGIDYQVYVYAQDIDENDMYGIDITPFGENGYLDLDKQYTLYVDSSGNSTEPMPNDDITVYVMCLLFGSREQRLIRGF